MNVKIISGPEWLPLQVQENLSIKRKRQAFFRELEEFNDKVILTEVQLPQLPQFSEKYTLYYFDKYYVYVHESVHDHFERKFTPYIEDLQIKYDNLINICIMVKNAGDDFRDILTRNLPYMDRYTILDTGSTDNTVNIIKEVLKNKRGELYEEPFINFRDSRNRLLDLAGNHCHFNIMLDDTYVLNGKIREFLDFARGDDVVTSYSIVIDDLDSMYVSNRVTKPLYNLRYINIIHEIIQTENNLNVSIPYEWGYIKDEKSEYMNERTKARKQKDIDLLMDMLKDNPHDPRTYYYIADSYIFMKDWENAVKWFKKRVLLNGYSSEIQDSLYYIAVIKDKYLNHPWEECLEWYMKCYEFDPKRSESLYFIADHYRKMGMIYIAFIYLKKAYELGMPEIQMSVRKNIYNFHIPKDLASLCYEIGEYKLGEEAARKALEWQKDEITENWLHILYHINQGVNDKNKIRISQKKVICFVSPGGWSEWDGETLRTKGIGGSENFTIRYAEYMSKMGYQIFVFCKCNTEKKYEEVTYFPIETFDLFVSTYIIDICIINRFPEFISVSCLNNIKTYYVLHDIASNGGIIPLSPNLHGILCISEWHKQQFLNFYPSCEKITEVISYGIETDVYNTKIEKQKYNFIYPSFPNRGLLQLLKMWPKIITKYPEAYLDVFCNTKNDWCQKYWANDMFEIDYMLEKYKDTITNHGWVNGETLRYFWSKAHIWFYPCTFEETCCLTSWEAAASKTLVVSNNLAALQTSIGNRGVIIQGNASEESWHEQALEKMFEVLDSKTEQKYIDMNFEWVKTKKFEIVVSDFVKKYIE